MKAYIWKQCSKLLAFAVLKAYIWRKHCSKLIPLAVLIVCSLVWGLVLRPLDTARLGKNITSIVQAPLTGEQFNPMSSASSAEPSQHQNTILSNNWIIPKELSDYEVYQLPPGTLPHPHGLSVIGSTAFTIDRGELQAITLQPGGRLQPLTPKPGAGPSKDLIDLTVAPNGRDIWAIDRMGDLFEYRPGEGSWDRKRTIEDRYSEPGELYLALASYNQRAYILDEAQGQVWRFPVGDQGEGYIPGSDVWERTDNYPELTRSVDLAVDGDVYLLVREELEKQQPARIVRLTGSPPTYAWIQKEEDDWHEPMALVTAPDKQFFLIADGGKALLELDKNTGVVIQKHVLPDTELIRAAAFSENRLYLLAADKVLVWSGKKQQVMLSSDVSPLTPRPDDLKLLGAVRLQPPVDARYLPDHDAVLPGAPRLYRFGVHEGVDFYGMASGITMSQDTPVKAAAAGSITRIDHEYQELTPAQYQQRIETAKALRNTPEDTEDLLRGRQVWIDHGNHVVTRYAHLSSVSDELVVGQRVAAGTIIGHVGNSGTEDGMQGSDQGLHLHFEIRVGKDYVGRWLNPLETRRVLNQIFGFK